MQRSPLILPEIHRKFKPGSGGDAEPGASQFLQDVESRLSCPRSSPLREDGLLSPALSSRGGEGDCRRKYSLSSSGGEGRGEEAVYSQGSDSRAFDSFAAKRASFTCTESEMRPAEPAFRASIAPGSNSTGKLLGPCTCSALRGSQG